MEDLNLSEILDGADFPPSHGWPPKVWVAVACDRVGDIGAVTCVQRTTYQSFFSMTTVFAREKGRWIEAFENGDQWPLDPTAPRPASGRAFALLTGTSGAAIGSSSARVAFVAGVVARAVARLHLSSAIEDHEVAIDDGTGAFVALSLQPDDAATFHLVALGPDGAELDRIEYQDPWSA